MSAILQGPSRELKSGATPRQLVVLLHGWGASGDDLIGLADGWGPRLPETAFVAPHAPHPCESNPFGRQWFSLANPDPRSLSLGAEKAAPEVNRFIDAALGRYGLSDDRLALVGFSQGTMLALYVALRRPRSCAGVVGYSGALLGAEDLPRALQARPPVLLVHGDSDPIVPAAALSAAVDALRRLEVPVEGHLARGIGHTIDGQGLELGINFLNAIFSG